MTRMRPGKLLAELLDQSSPAPAVLVGDAPPMREQVLDGADVHAVLIFRDSPDGMVVDTYCRHGEPAELAPILREHAATLDGGR